MKDEFDLISLEAIQVRADAATKGPWEVFERDYTVRGGTEYTEFVIGTAYPHPQLDGPEPIIAISYSGSPDGKGQTKVFMSRADAEFIAHARHDVPALLEAVRELMTRVVTK